MKMHTQTTSIVLRVFFILLFVSIAGFAWQKMESKKTEIKAIGGTYTEGIIGAPRFINPVLAQSQADNDLAKLIFTPLLTIDRDGSVHYQAAESIERSDDGLSYTVALRNDTYFEDEKPLTSDDVHFTITSIQDPLIKSPLASQWEGISIEIIDSKNLVFKLARPFNDFLYNLEIGILPKHIWENINPQEFVFSTYNTNPVGSGPYKVKQTLSKESGAPEEYRLVRSDNYFEKNYIKNINFLFFNNEKDLISGLKSGVVDGAYGISPENITSGEINKDLVHEGSLPRVFALFFNQEKQPLLKSKKIREAIHYGINKEELINNNFSQFASAIDSPLGFIQSENSFNTAKAESLIQSEGWKRNTDGYYSKILNGKTVELGFSIATPNLDEMIKVSEHIQNNLANIGIRVAIRSYDQGNLSQNIIRSREYESLLFGYEIKKPSDMYAFWHSSQIIDPGLNISLYKNGNVDQSLEKLRTNSIEDFSKIDSQIKDDIPAIFLYSPSYLYILPDAIKNTELSIISSEDRFNDINQWYIETRHIWNKFIK